MARVLISYRHLDGAKPSDKSYTGEIFSGVFNQRAKACGFVTISEIVAQQVAILFHRRAAAGGVDDDRVDVGFQKDIDVVPRHLLGGGALAVVNIQRAAADLVFRQYDIAAVASQHAHGGFIDIAEQQRHDTTVQHGDLGATFADSGTDTRDGVLQMWG